MCPSWKIMEFVNGNDDIPIYEMENNPNDPNHQADMKADFVWKFSAYSPAYIINFIHE